MIVDCIADLHGNYPKLEGGDLLIVAGDLTASHKEREFYDFANWLQDQEYEEKIVIAGNHDSWLVGLHPKILENWSEDHGEFEYLCDSGTEFEYDRWIEDHLTTATLKIWGSPWTKRFDGMNPEAMAFTVDTDEELAEKWALIPDDVDILVTHGPPECVLDSSIDREHCGSISLLMRSSSLKNLKLFVFGHIHESYGIYTSNELIDFSNQYKKVFGPAKCKSFPHIVNASHVNEHYEPVNKPIRIEI